MSEFYTIKRKTHGKLINEQLRASAIFPPLAYDDEGGLFIGDDKTIGFSFLCNVLPGRENSTEQQTNSLLNEESIPSGADLQHCWIKSPDIVRQVFEMVRLRENNNNTLLADTISARANFLHQHTASRLISDNDSGRFDLGLINDVKLIVTLKVPMKGDTPTQKEYDDIRSLRTKVRTTLENLKHYPITLDASSWIRVMNTMFNWGGEASWRAGACEWDKTQPLCNQVLDFDNDIEVSKDHLRIGNQYVKCLSAKRLPEAAYFGDAKAIAGDMSGGLGGVRQNYIVCTNVHYPDAENEKGKIERKRQFAINQASGPMAKFVPQLADKRNDFDNVWDSITEGKRPIKVSYHVVVFGESKEEVESAAMTARNFWRTNRFEIMVDKFIQLPILINCLPLCADAEAVGDLNRHKSMTANEASVLLPMFGEWKGTGTPHVNLLSRNMQLMSLSLHDSGSNKNALVFGSSGKGKSFMLNEIISSYLSEGAEVFIIDIGRSYQKLTEVLGGDFISFEPNSDVCLNPFPGIVSLDGTKETRAPAAPYLEGDDDDDGEEDVVIGLLEAMAAPKEALTDFQIAGLKRVLGDVWRKHFRETSIDLIQEALLSEKDVRIKDIGHQLHAFTSLGSYGRFFNGECNIHFSKQLTCLELDDLRGKTQLQAAVLLQVLTKIQQDMYLGDRSVRKLIVIDESFDLLTSGDTSKFITGLFRRARKYNGSVVVCSQGLLDVYDSPSGRAIAENSATMLLLGQKAEAIEEMKREGRLELSDHDFSQLKTVHTVPGVYSEIFIKSEYGIGIGRLIVNDFQKLMYSTRPEDLNAIKRFTDQGLGMAEAINAVLQDRRDNRKAA